MEWSEENILGRGRCRNKDTEELRVLFFVFFLSRVAIGILARTVIGHCPLPNYTAHSLYPFPT